MEKLAIHGGTPASERLLGYGRQSIDEDDVAAVVDVLGSDFLTCDPPLNASRASLGKPSVRAMSPQSPTALLRCMSHASLQGSALATRSSCPRLRSPLRLTACFTAVAPLCSLT